MNKGRGGGTGIQLPVAGVEHRRRFPPDGYFPVHCFVFRVPFCEILPCRLVEGPRERMPNQGLGHRRPFLGRRRWQDSLPLERISPRGGRWILGLNWLS